MYLHVPFCVKKCYFCSFNTAPMGEDVMQQYLRALHREIDLVGALRWARQPAVETIFFGGGTPSLLTGDALAEILERLRQTFVVDPDNVIQHVSVNNLNVGRNPDEILRILDGLQTDDLCPCNRAVGGDTL